jgi:hypothetical protein
LSFPVSNPVAYVPTGATQESCLHTEVCGDLADTLLRTGAVHPERIRVPVSANPFLTTIVLYLFVWGYVQRKIPEYEKGHKKVSLKQQNDSNNERDLTTTTMSETSQQQQQQQLQQQEN